MIKSVTDGQGDRLLSVPGKTPDQEGTMKTVCALVFVASVIYILLILWNFT